MRNEKAEVLYLIIIFSLCAALTICLSKYASAQVPEKSIHDALAVGLNNAGAQLSEDQMSKVNLELMSFINTVFQDEASKHPECESAIQEFYARIVFGDFL